jgi:two-component system, LytTR family, response regulator
MLARTHLMRGTITQLERELDPSTFCRIHRSRIINVWRIQTLTLNEGPNTTWLCRTGAACG